MVVNEVYRLFDLEGVFEFLLWFGGGKRNSPGFPQYGSVKRGAKQTREPASRESAINVLPRRVGEHSRWSTHLLSAPTRHMLIISGVNVWHGSAVWNTYHLHGERMINVLMPRLSESMTEGKMLRWCVPSGGNVEKGDVIAEVEADKANMEIEAPATGLLHHGSCKPGEMVPVGTVIATIQSPTT